MNREKTMLCVRNLHTPSGRGSGIVAEKEGGVFRIRHIGSLSGMSFGPEARVVDGEGGILVPAFCDLYGFPDRQRSAASLKEETLAAARAGYGILTDFDPPLGEDARGASLSRLAGARCTVLPIEPIPADPAQIAPAKARGAFALSDGGRPIADPAHLLAVMEEAARCDLLLMLSPFCPDWQGVLHAGRVASYYRVSGIPDVAEEMAVCRLLLLARTSGCRVHIPCISTAGALGQIRRAKADGVRVSCGVTPFHIACTAEDVFLSGTAAKLNPPLTDSDHVRALLGGIADGTVDCISSGHVPCRRWEKQKPMASAAFGAPSYGTALGVCTTRLLGSGVIGLERLIALLSEAPAAILGQENRLKVGAEARFAILDPRREWVVGEDPTCHAGMTPFTGQTLHGKVIHSFISGQWY